MTDISRRSALIGLGGGALAAAATAALPTTAQAALKPAPAHTGETIVVPTPGPAKFGLRFDCPEELAAYTRYDYLTAHQPLLIGHRGGYYPDGPWPESALESMQNILATRGSVFVEMDMRMTKDGRCINMHDDTIDRETTGKGKMSTLEAYVLDQRLVNAQGKTTQLRPRLVQDIFEWAKRVDAVLWVDIKDATPEYVVRQIREYELESQVVLSAYGAKNVARFRQLAPECVYFIPTDPGSLPTVQSIKSAARIGKVIGFAGWYLPDMRDSLTMQDDWNAPMQLEMNRYDHNLHNDELDG
ncbi:glycerophosphodiester phosphodiesterase family protein [Nigerium massiliense]|uniref:glycerophosphodiester phosphodiesterase family protein n=1 Tax=Nigerium massiliense TaxID=1522317 RepID=UPI00069488A0|nr:glycerophosphodiester phosphodiesterase family protein [Nigerium massiliense]